MLGNILKQTKDLFGSIYDTTYETYNPLLALFSIIGILQTLFGAFVAARRPFSQQLTIVFSPNSTK
jgi:hypothetical protein